ncbi:hypothetical protein PFICI_10549 [Pestalotiopsis fici W106-1]|uniref:Cyclin N-terminal domain-containing protein n=1 Tax=Pestalotiopsis fici (strain W106-1 / CGMCC3.15140) TaxID=1229662 RepID=W3WZC5_PESFW|nr:uncharacterized protein PFICI_10549 [Pestalotiopsis fici W106-1]ETS78487.1 hypothetical protein PFICI_10549 [Pestalotiopsis fici W106-1]
MRLRSNDDSLPVTHSHGPYNTSLASTASSSASSIFSDASSQQSDDTSISAYTSDSLDACRSRFSSSEWTESYSQRSAQQVPQHMRQNPRRTSASSISRTGCPPTLVRQGDRKVNFVDNLVDSSTQIVEAIWPLSSIPSRAELGQRAVLPLRTFIQETLRRSRTSYSTLQVALYYLVLIKPHVPKHDFTMEQPDDVLARRALQCGRRMFLAALILASKYLQDRNYSARAWSKISGLATQEINQNEMAFLLAVNWKLHITDDVFQRWTDIVLKYTPSQPPSPGGISSPSHEAEVQNWKNLILQLTPELDNVGGIVSAKSKSTTGDFRVMSPRSLLSATRERSRVCGSESNESTPTPRSYDVPYTMEPAPKVSNTPGLLAPALGLLPTPRLTPQSSGLGTPAASTSSCLLGAKGSMGFAMAHASAAQNSERWPGTLSTSPLSYYQPARRSSLANSVSTASSPESMVSDTSRTSRSSSISSASSLVSAPSTKLDVQARCRSAKLCSERYSMRPTIASVREDYEENCITSSPESYTGPVGKDLMEMSLDTPLAKSSCENDDTAADAARALQELQNSSFTFHAVNTMAGSKRSRPTSMECPLQENVRGLLCSEYGSKRMCYSTDASILPITIPSVHPAMGGLGGPGMWGGIL